MTSINTFSENFDILCEEHLISEDLCSKLISMAGFRNVLAHEYEKMDGGLADIEEFVKIVEKNKESLKKLGF